MNKYILILSLILVIVTLKAQEYQITFAGKGASTLVDSVKIQNLTKGITITLGGTEVLQLQSTSTGIKINENPNNTLRIYPNPMNESSTIEFWVPSSGETNFEIYDMTGKKMGGVRNTLVSGNHFFKISGLGNGIYILKLEGQNYSYAGQLVSNSKTKSYITITYQGVNSISEFPLKLKSANTTTMPYTTDDVILFKGISGNYTTVVANRPKQSNVLTFEFVPCTDADGNNYPVVQIGTQMWMATNLKTTKYNNSDPISTIINNSNWETLTTGSGWNYANDVNNGSTYGRLYNWYAVNDKRNIAPQGWHVSTDPEWTTLMNYLGGESVAGGKLKETGTAHWYNYNYFATNETGFSALPGGAVDFEKGEFSALTITGCWWSASENNTLEAWYRMIVTTGGLVDRSSLPKVEGFSVRCVRD